MRAPVQLILPPLDDGHGRLSRSGCFPPLGLVSIATALEYQTGVRAEILDGELLDFAAIASRVSGGVVGISISQVTYENSLLLATLAKSRGARTVLGGHHATALAEAIVRTRPDVDAVVAGDGEEAFVRFCQEEPLERIPNLVYLDDRGSVRRTPRRDAQLDKLQVPDRTFLQLPAYFRNFESQNSNKRFRRPFSLFTQKGCAWRDRSGGCSFCARTDTGWRARRVDLVWQEIETLVGAFSADYIWELSDDILSDDGWFRTLVESKPGHLGPAFLCYARPARVTARTADLLACLGAYEVFLGVESGDDRLLRLANKGSLSQTNQRATHLLKSRGIRIFPSFVLGLQGETRDSLKRTEDHLDELLEGGLVDTVAVSIFMPLPGSPGFAKLQSHSDFRERYGDRDDVPLEVLQEEWCQRFCAVPLGLILEARERMLTRAPVGSGLGVRAHSPRPLPSAAVFVHPMI